MKYDELGARARSRIEINGCLGSDEEETRELVKEACESGEIETWKQCGAKTLAELKEFAFAESDEPQEPEAPDKVAPDADMPECCGGCKAFLPDPSAKKDGICRRNPPQIFAGEFRKDRWEGTAAWPEVDASDWCGQFDDGAKAAFAVGDTAGDEDSDPAPGHLVIEEESVGRFGLLRRLAGWLRAGKE